MCVCVGSDASLSQALQLSLALTQNSHNYRGNFLSTDVCWALKAPDHVSVNRYVLTEQERHRALSVQDGAPHLKIVLEGKQDVSCHQCTWWNTCF